VPATRSGRGHWPEQFPLLAQDGQTADRLTAVAEQDRQIGQDPTWIVTRAATAGAGQDVAERCGQAGRLGDVGQQTVPGVGDDPGPTGSDHHRGPMLVGGPGSASASAAGLAGGTGSGRPCTLHSRSASHVLRIWTFDKSMNGPGLRPSRGRKMSPRSRPV
jgi:hypothetical protein